MYDLRRDGYRRIRVGSHLHGEAAAERVDPLAQAAYSRLHRIVCDQRFDGFVRNGHLFPRDPHRLHRLGHQMLPCDLQLLQRRIALELDHFHAVQQRLGNGVEAVGGADEKHVGQVIGHIHVVVGKGVVLLRVEHLQQRAGGAAVIGGGKLVHLVEHHHRVGNAALVDAVHDAARHGSYVSAPVAPDIALVMDTAEAHAHILAAQRAGDALPDAGLARARCSCEQQNGAGLLLFEIHHCDLLDDPVLYLFQPVVILVQNAARVGKVDLLGLFFLP